VALARRDAAQRLGLVEREPGETDLARGGAQPVAIAALQRRTREHHAAARLRLREHAGERVEPHRAVRVGERDAGAHLRDVGGRVVCVAFDERDADQARRRRADG